MQIRNEHSRAALFNPASIIARLWRHRELIWQFTVRNIEMRHRGSVFGFAWAALNPLLLLALYVFVFGFVFEGKFGVTPDETKWSYGLGIFLALVVFHVVAESLAAAPNVIVSQPNFVKKVVFPLEILPVAAVGATVFHMLVSLGMVLIGLVLGGCGLHLAILQLPLILIPLVAFALGLAWTVAALGVFFRDIGQIVQVCVTGLMFGSAVFYSPSKVPPEAWAFLRFNPILHFIELARDLMLWRLPIDYGLLGALYLFSFGFAVLGHAIFQRLKPAFSDVI